VVEWYSRSVECRSVELALAVEADSRSVELALAVEGDSRSEVEDSSEAVA